MTSFWSCSHLSKITPFGKVFKMMLFWSQASLNNVVLICIKNKIKKQNDVVLCPTETQRRHFGIGVVEKGKPFFLRATRKSKNEEEEGEEEEEEEEEEGEEGEGDLHAPRCCRVVFFSSSSARQSGLGSVGVCSSIVTPSFSVLPQVS